MKSTFQYTIIPGATQYSGASSDGRLPRKRVSTDVEARAAAAKDPKVSYYCQIDAENFEFYTSNDFWLGANSSHTTTVVTELADTSDKATEDEVLTAIRSRLHLGPERKCIDTRGYSREKPLEISVGFVFCDFDDAPGTADDLARLNKDLVGPDVSFSIPGTGGAAATKATDTALNAFFRRESHGRATLKVTPATKWTRVGTKGTYFTPEKVDLTALEAAADAAATLPTAEVLVFAFPSSSGLKFSSQYLGAAFVEAGARSASDSGKETRLVFMDPTACAETAKNSTGATVNVTHRTTGHEILHACGLPDQYSSEMNRSYGWSVMSDCRTGWHITGLEKLALGWNDLTDYWVLRRGLLPIHELVAQAEDAGKKGVIVMPDAKQLRPEVYGIERPQAIGRNEEDRTKVEDEQATDPGLLVLMVRADLPQGRMSPFVASRPTDTEERWIRGGASRAPFTAKQDFNTNGILGRATPAYKAADGTEINRVIGVDALWEPFHRQRTLRESEMVWKSTVSKFELTTAGVLTMDGGPAIPLTDQAVTDEEALQGVGTVKDQDYGYQLDITDDLVLQLRQGGAGATTTPLRSFAKPTFKPSNNLVGKPVLVVESHGSKVRDATLAIYLQAGQGQAKQYDVFRRATCVRGDALAWARDPKAPKPTSPAPAPPVEAALEADGNLTVRQASGEYITGTYDKFGEKFFSCVDVDEQGTIRLLDSFGAQVQKIPATSIGVAPFALVLRLDSAVAAGAIVVQDTRGQVVNTLLTW